VDENNVLRRKERTAFSRLNARCRVLLQQVISIRTENYISVFAVPYVPYAESVLYVCFFTPCFLNIFNIIPRCTCRFPNGIFPWVFRPECYRSFLFITCPSYLILLDLRALKELGDKAIITVFWSET
jgi:hypothetical protein